MTNTPDVTPCVSGGNGLLPVDPYRSLRAHFGMLLGVDDFATVDAYHRGKMWLHNAWLHGEGAVWGLAVSLDLEHGEIRVAPGLAVDALGRELHLEADACVNVGRWFDEHRDDVELLDAEGVQFDAHVVIQFKGCLSRQVPALSEPCEGAGNTTAYSRVLETVELLLLPGESPPREPPLTYHRLRLLFHLEDPIEEDGAIIASDQEVIDRRDEILGLPAAEQPERYLHAFREFAALDEIDLRPGENDGERSLFPTLDPAPLVLADCRLTLSGTEGNWTLEGLRVRNSVRRTLVPTTTIQELLCGPLFSGESPGNGGPPPADAGGPRIDRASVIARLGNANSIQIEFRIAGTPAENGIDSAISLALFAADQGWTQVQTGSVSFVSEDGTVTVNTGDDSANLGSRLRLIVRGTGIRPLLGEDGVPLAGETGGPPGTEHDGNDFVHMMTVDLGS